MKCLVLLAMLLAVPASYGQAARRRNDFKDVPDNYRAGAPPPAMPPTRTRSGAPPPPMPDPPRAKIPPTRTRYGALPPPAANLPPTRTWAGAPPPPVPGPAFYPPGAPVSRRRIPPQSYNMLPAAPPANVPSTRTRSLGMLRPLPPMPPTHFNPYNPYVPYVPTTFGTPTMGWVPTGPPDIPEVKKEEEEESR